MDSKPASYNRIVAGKALAAVKGFVAMCNWVFAFLFNLRGESGIEIVDGDIGNPKIRLKLEAGDGVTIEDSGDAKKISATGGGSDTISVITGIAFTVNSGDPPSITAVATRRLIKAVDAGQDTPANIDVASFEYQDVVVSSAYDDRIFTNNRQRLAVLNHTSSTNQEVFTATPYP